MKDFDRTYMSIQSNIQSLEKLSSEIARHFLDEKMPERIIDELDQIGVFIRNCAYRLRNPTEKK